jgi:UTP--glucose-1-phosphate uridylyltransferase
VIAILPAAGKGTRMADVTEGSSKELLEVGGRSVLDWALDEAHAGEASRIVVVSSPEKRDMNERLERLSGNVQIEMQFVQDGLAPAIALGAASEPALIILPDTLYFPNVPSPRIARALSEGFDIVLLTETVPDELVSHYGIVETDANGGVQRVIEKPSHFATQSRQAVAGRYGLSSKMMGFLLQALESLRDAPGEIALTPILNLAIKNGYDAIAIPTLPTERRFDCGSPEGYRAACEAIG